MASKKGSKFLMSSSESDADSDVELEVKEDMLHDSLALVSEIDGFKDFKTATSRELIVEDSSLGEDEDELLQEPQGVVIRKSIRKSIVLISSGESGSDSDDEAPNVKAEKVKAPSLPPPPAVESNFQQRPSAEVIPKKETLPVAFKALSTASHVRPKQPPKTKLNLAKLDMLENEKKNRTTKKILNLNQLEKATRSADRAEKERRKRIEKKSEQFQEVFPNEDPVTSPILDFDPDRKKVLVKIHKEFASLLKPHQLEGVKFMYNCVIESLDALQRDEFGSGCILAHSMGLGKTFQIVAFLHSILTNPYIQEIIECVLIIVPYNVIENWAQEFDKWFTKCNITWPINIFEMRTAKTLAKRIDLMRTWYKRGGIMLITSNLFTKTVTSAVDAGTANCAAIRKYLLNPGPDLVIIDEGHLLKNEKGTFNQALSFIATQRRIVLTGTPLQNNLSEYFVMVDFVKKNLLGTKEEFKNRFQNPVEEGQHEDSTKQDVMRMKRRIHVLFQMLKGCIHRCDYNILVPYLQPKFEYVLIVRLTDIQINMYKHYLNYFADLPTGEKGAKKNLFRDKNQLSLIWTHPAVIHDYYEDSKSKDNFAKQIGPWYQQFVDLNNIYNIELSNKFVLLFNILEVCEKIGDKVVIFSQSLLNLDLIEKLLKRKMKSFNQENNLKNLNYKQILQKTGGVSHQWSREKDYFRIDGSVDSTDRTDIIERFNDTKDTRARLMLVSTRAGGIGTNLIGANRAIIFDASFNPSHDLQAIFRIYRLGQTKPVYVYRMVAYGTMEDKIYKRQIVKQSLSRRVVDEQQIVRHYKKNDLMELFRLETDFDTDRVLPLSDDNLLNDLLFDYANLIISFHEHDSLLENKPEEELTEEERKAAWTEFEKARVTQNHSQAKGKFLKTGAPEIEPDLQLVNLDDEDEESMEVVDL